MERNVYMYGGMQRVTKYWTEGESEFELHTIPLETQETKKNCSWQPVTFEQVLCSLLVTLRHVLPNWPLSVLMFCLGPYLDNTQRLTQTQTGETFTCWLPQTTLGVLYIHQSDLERVEALSLTANGNPMTYVPGWLWRYLCKTYKQQFMTSSGICMAPINAILNLCIPCHNQCINMVSTDGQEIPLYWLFTGEVDTSYYVSSRITCTPLLCYWHRDFPVTLGSSTSVDLLLSFLQLHLYVQLWDAQSMQPVAWQDYITRLCLIVDGISTPPQLLQKHLPETTYHIPIDPFTAVYVFHPIDPTCHFSAVPLEEMPPRLFWGGTTCSAVNFSRTRDPLKLSWTWKDSLPVTAPPMFILRVGCAQANLLSAGYGSVVWRFAN